MNLSFNIGVMMKDRVHESFVFETEKRQKRIENNFTNDYTKKGKKWKPISTTVNRRHTIQGRHCSQPLKKYL